MNAIAPSPTTAARLAEWVAEIELDAIPDTTRQHAKTCIIDSVACLIGSLRLEPMRILIDVLAAESGEGTIPIPGTDRKLSLTAAACFGSQAANALDFDDSFRAGAPSHPGATVVPPALAVAMAQDSSGAELLNAVIAGFEVSLRIGRAVRPTPARTAAVMGYAAWQAFGAATVATKLMKLPASQIRAAFGLTGAQAPLPSGRKFLNAARPYSWVKNPYGIASSTAVLSALLARRGYHGDPEIFDGPHGFWIMCGSDQYRPELATEALGQLWLIHDVGYKPYACCRWTHTMIDAIRALKPELEGHVVAEVHVTGFRELACSLAGDPPATIVDAQFNARYVAALELAGHSPEFGLREAQLSDPEVRRLVETVRLVHEPEFDQAYFEKAELPVRVDVLTASGKTLTASVVQPAGSPEAGGFSDADADRKFLQLVSPVLGDGRARAALAALRTIEKHSAREVCAALSR